MTGEEGESASPRADVPLELSQTIEYSHALISALPEATVIVVGADETLWMAEGKLLERQGFPASALHGRKLADVLPASKAATLRERYRRALRGEKQSFDYRTVDGKTLCWIQLTPMYFGSSMPCAVTAVVQDVTAREEMTARLRAEERRRRDAEDLAGVAHWEVELATGRVTLSQTAACLLGFDHDLDLDLEGCLALVVDADRSRVRGTLLSAGRDGVGECECDLVRADGEVRHLLLRATRFTDAYAGEMLIGTAVDLTERARAERERAESASLFREGFDGSPVAMALIDPESLRYVRVNEAMCRLLGRDRAELLQLSYRDVTHPEDLADDESVREALTAVRHGIKAEKRYLTPDGGVVHALLYVSPVQGPDGRVRGFFSQMVDLTERKEREHRLALENHDLERLREIRAAITDERFVLHAQPIYDLRSGDLVQRELLVRMCDGQGGLVPPLEFLPIAERYGCIDQIDCWVTERAIEMAAGGEPVEVNLSAASVGSEQLLRTIREALSRTGADPSLIVFEVTETALMADVARGREFASSLRGLGCRFALDDFGTGYGTFTYLRHIPTDYLKIDVEFVRGLDRSPDDQRLVQAIVTMARDLGKKTIAEGVESAEVLRCLLDLGVDHAQGYYLGRPAPIDA